MVMLKVVSSIILILQMTHVSLGLQEKKFRKGKGKNFNFFLFLGIDKVNDFHIIEWLLCANFFKLKLKPLELSWTKRK